MAEYRLDPEAEKDLEGIARYTRKQWGKNQNTIYRRKLVSCFNDIAEGNVRNRSLKGTNKNLFFVHCERHYIFYLRSTTPVTIVAVLHERMDLIYQINKRRS